MTVLINKKRPTNLGEHGGQRKKGIKGDKPTPKFTLPAAQSQARESFSQLLDQAIERSEYYEYEAAWHRAQAFNCELEADQHRAIKRVIEGHIFGEVTA